MSNISQIEIYCKKKKDWKTFCVTDKVRGERNRPASISFWENSNSFFASQLMSHPQIFTSGLHVCWLLIFQTSWWLRQISGQKPFESPSTLFIYPNFLIARDALHIKCQLTYVVFTAMGLFNRVNLLELSFLIWKVVSLELETVILVLINMILIWW